jgi:hypothetical protein
MAIGCDGKGPGLSKSDLGAPAAEPPAPPANGPKLGVVSTVVQIYEHATKSSPKLGSLRAGAKVARSDTTVPAEDCKAGYYAIHPRGFVCAEGTTTDLEHPTLVAMALEPKLDQALPYAYARTAGPTSVFERDASREDGVREAGKLKKNAGLAVVGSWAAKDPKGRELRLGLTTGGRFVQAEDLAAMDASTFSGVKLDEAHALPVAFVVKRGVNAWAVEEQHADKKNLLDYHATLMLTGRYRELAGVRFWAVDDGRFVRHADVTVIRKRHVFPDFVQADTKWLDVSVVTGTLTAYVGKNAVFTTLVSVGRDRLGDPETTASTRLGTFEVVSKSITMTEMDPLEQVPGRELADIPWGIELSSGQPILGAYFHDRFGIENTNGALHLSPSDAAFVWRFIGLELPAGWHSVRAAGSTKIQVVVRK